MENTQSLLIGIFYFHRVQVQEKIKVLLWGKRYPHVALCVYKKKGGRVTIHRHASCNVKPMSGSKCFTEVIQATRHCASGRERR